MRVACLFMPNFPLAALVRAEPKLHAASVVVVDGKGSGAKVLAVSAEAARYGVTPGRTAAQAAAIDARLVIRPVSSDTLHAAQAALCDAAASFSPRVEDAGGGMAYLDLDGLRTLFARNDGDNWELPLANALAQRAAQLGCEAYVGIAGSKIAAHLAARNGGGVTVIPAGDEWSFLAPVPIALLDPSPELATTLQRWGIRSIGDLAALPASAVGARLGPEGVLLVRRARAEDEYPLVPRPLPLHFYESIDLEYGIEMLEPFLFVLRGLLDRLTVRLEARGFICGDLRLSLRLATGGWDERTVGVAVPSNDVKALLSLVRLHLEAHPPNAAAEAVRIAAVPEHLRAAQLDLFRPNGPAPARLAVTLARLTAICGADRVGVPLIADTHRPDAYGVTSFEAVRLLSCYGVSEENGGSAPNTLTPNSLTTCSLALRAVRPPQVVEVFCDRDRPEFVRGDRFAGRVVQAAGPWRVQGEWWSDTAYARDYYDTQLSDGCVYRLYRDLRTRSWFVDGMYD